MAKNMGSTRTTISVPADLRKRMDKVKEPVNWSALACSAFEQKLGEIASKKEKKSMSDVIARLKASKQASDSVVYREGFEAGEDWAKQYAEAAELRRLDHFKKRIETEPVYGWQWFFSEESDDNSRFSTADLLANEITGDSMTAAEFWESAVGPDDARLADKEFLRGFAEGAASIWDSVKNQI
jgi:predicted CopG family antitoxin